jgi:hypothetical protein
VLSVRQVLDLNFWHPELFVDCNCCGGTDRRRRHDLHSSNRSSGKLVFPRSTSVLCFPLTMSLYLLRYICYPLVASTSLYRLLMSTYCYYRRKWVVTVHLLLQWFCNFTIVEYRKARFMVQCTALLSQSTNIAVYCNFYD